LDSYTFMSSGMILPMLNWTPSNRPTAMNVSERLDFILRSVLYHLEKELGIDESLDDWFIQNGLVFTPNPDIDNLICKLLSEKFEPSRGSGPGKPRRPAPDIPKSSPTSPISRSSKPGRESSDRESPKLTKITSKNIIKITDKNEKHRSAQYLKEEDSSEDYLYERDYEKLNFAPNQILTLAEDYQTDEFTASKNEHVIFLDQNESWIKVRKSTDSKIGWICLQTAKLCNT